eukprot:193646-Chlamydomonas_euryale.AAC.3
MQDHKGVCWSKWGGHGGGYEAEGKAARVKVSMLVGGGPHTCTGRRVGASGEASLDSNRLDLGGIEEECVCV